MGTEESIVYLNGEFVPASKASLSIFDAGIVIGATVAEMTRTFHHKPFRLEDHLERFYRSCAYTRIKPPFDLDRMREVSLQVLDNNARLIDKDQELGLIHFITPGQFAVYAGSAAGTGEMKPTICIHTFPLPFHLFAHLFRDGAHVVTPSIRHVPPQCIDPKIKHRSRMHQWLADQETHLVAPKAVTLWLDLDGNITETSGSNFAIVRDGEVLAPTFRNTLGGISLLMVKELCEELGIKFEQRDIQVYDVINADEAILTSTPYCIAPVTHINGARIGKGAVQGPIFCKLIQAWSKRVGLDITEQFTGSEFNRG